MNIVKRLFLIGLLATGSAVLAQTTFEKGYFIKANGERTEVFLRNTNWGTNPEIIEYKLTPEADLKQIPVGELTEFSVSNQWKYIVATVDFDRIETDLTKIGVVRNPAYKKETLPLKVLVEGKATLYAYHVNRQAIFFFKVDGGEIRQLVWKQYRASQLEIAANNLYQQQLWTEVNCNVKESTVKRLDYKLSALEKYFIEFNRCSGAEVQHQDQRKKGKFSLGITAGVGTATLDVEKLNMNPRPDIEFRDRLVAQVGVQLEFLLPFNDNKTSVLLNPTFQSFSANRDKPFENEAAEYKSLSIALGLRQYFFLTDDARIFINVMGNLDVPVSEDIEYSGFETRKSIGAVAGAGFMYKKFGIEGRYYFKQDVLASDLFVTGDYTRAMVLLSYRVF